MEQLRRLLAVREMRLERIRAELAEKISVLQGVEAELARVNEELNQISRQRLAWERDWQQWLREHGVVRHGQDYSLAHTALSAWQKDAAQAREEILLRYAKASAEVRTVRLQLLKAEQALAVLQEQLQKQQRIERVRRVTLVESRLLDEPRRTAVN